ncbi:MAG: RagB/SusD family nutrient uptake outer membrane protein [Candidatus Cryptobacteroides sp.]
MKHLKYIFAAILAVLCMGCSLEEDSSSFSTSEEFYQNVNQCKSALNSCYIPLKSLYNLTMMIATECVTDLAYSRSSTQDSDLDISPAKPRFGADVWTNCYKGIRYCNAAIAGIEKSPVSEEKKEQLLAEGKIMRGYYYWLLTCFFGDVPYYTDDVCDEQVLEKVTHLPRMSADATRAAIIEELWPCCECLPAIRSNEVEENRVGAAMGYMIIAKMAQWNKDWETSLKACKKIEEIYGELSQYPLSDIPFRYKNTPESIFEIQHTYSAGGLDYTSNVACMCMPYPRSGNKYSGVVIEELGGNCTSYAPAQANNYLVNNLLVEENNDLRRPMSIVREWNGQTFDYMKDTRTTAFFGPKFWCPGMQANNDSNNYKVFRYADVILMIAEAHCMLEDDMAESLKYLNMVKERAGIRLYTRTNPSAVLEEIQAERGRELFGEFQRKFDLVRWGIWYERTEAETRKTKLRENILPCHRYYPIPDTQVAYSGYALDNDEYHQYGL